MCVQRKIVNMQEFPNDVYHGTGVCAAQSYPGLCMRCLSYIHQAIPNHSTRTGVAVAATAHKSSAAVDVARMEAVPGQ